MKMTKMLFGASLVVATLSGIARADKELWWEKFADQVDMDPTWYAEVDNTGVGIGYGFGIVPKQQLPGELIGRRGQQQVGNNSGGQGGPRKGRSHNQGNRQATARTDGHKNCGVGRSAQKSARKSARGRNRLDGRVTVCERCGGSCTDCRCHQLTSTSRPTRARNAERRRQRQLQRQRERHLDELRGMADVLGDLGDDDQGELLESLIAAVEEGDAEVLAIDVIGEPDGDDSDGCRLYLVIIILIDDDGDGDWDRGGVLVIRLG